jgi:hypothetical protein
MTQSEENEATVKRRSKRREITSSAVTMAGMTMRKLPLLFLFLVLLVATAVQAFTEKAPVSLATSAKPKLLKPIAFVAGIVGLAVGKKAVNGPNFEEPVSLVGKVAVITGEHRVIG